MNRNKKRKVHMIRLNWDALYYADIINGIGFTITEPAEVSLDGTKQKSLYGPNSPLYGTSYEDEQSFIERCRCKCGEYRSHVFEGEICPKCGTKVENRDSDINITGWISLGSSKIINPLYFNIFCKVLGKTVFTDIVYSKYKITTDGKKLRAKEEDQDTKPSSIYAGIGVDEFYYRYEEILKYFMSQKKNKVSSIKLLLKQKANAFTSHIPIPSTLLRPQSITAETFYYASIDKLINTTFTLSKHLKSCINVERDYILQRLQIKVNKMWNVYFEELNGKEGWIRGELLGGSLNNTSRNVIVPDPTLKDNELDLSYHTFLEVFKFKIIKYIMVINDCTLSKAESIWKAASNFDERVYNIMQHIVEKEKVHMLINRNPTLNFYSMLLMKVRKIKKSGTDYSLSVPLSILPGLNADFDGDILNIIGIVDPAIAYMFRKFDPIRRMIISRDSGLINEYFTIVKGQLIDLYYFGTIGATANDEVETYPVLDDNGSIIWVPEDEVKNYKSGIYEDAYLMSSELNPELSVA